MSELPKSLGVRAWAAGGKSWRIWRKEGVTAGFNLLVPGTTSRMKDFQNFHSLPPS